MIQRIEPRAFVLHWQFERDWARPLTELREELNVVAADSVFQPN